MKTTAVIIALLAITGIASASNVTNLFPNGDFEAGGAGDWVEGGCDFFSYPSSDGNPGGYGIIDDTTPCWGIWVGGDTTALSLTSLGLTAGKTYTFVQDMKIISGTSIGGIKVESWTTNNLGSPVLLGTSGDMRPLSGTTDWKTYAFTYTINSGATGLKIVPLWGPSSAVGFDNLGVVLPGPAPASVSITSPTNNQVVYSNFTINASAMVSPGTVTNVGFYVDNTLAGFSTNSPFGYIASGISSGIHTLMAVAKDSNGNAATSSVVNITVTNASPPTYSAYESFNYGSLADGTPTAGNGFASNWICGAAGTIVPGLTYASLTTADNALESSSSYQLTSLSNTLSGVETIWVSFLFKQNGDNGGNRDGLVLEDSSGKGIMFSYYQNQTAVGNPAVVTVGSYTTVGTTLSPHSAIAQTYSSNNLYVLKLTYNGGSLGSVTVYSNPTIDQGTIPTPDFTVTSGLSGIGVPSLLGVVHQGAISITVDEIRLGGTFADVMGGKLTPAVPTTLALSISTNKMLSWAASSTNYYQPQKSADNNTWYNLGNPIFGSTATSIYDFVPEPYYQVLEIAPAIQEEIVDGGFEVDGGDGTAFYWVSGGSQPPARIASDFHSGAACISLYVTNSSSTANTFNLQQNLTYAGSQGITGGNTYALSFWVKSLGKNQAGGYIQQYRLTWLNDVSASVGTVGWTGFNADNDAWTQINTGPVIAPATAVNALIEVYGATGAILNDFGGLLIDDVSLGSFSPGSVINVLSPTVQDRQGFTAAIMANGGAATEASGNVRFTTNSIVQSIGTIVNGNAYSAPVSLPLSYTVTATYLGDANYIGSQASLTVGSDVNLLSTNIVASVAGNQFTLSWPADHIGWSLQAQTNSASVGLTTNWYEVSGSTVTNKMSFTIDPNNPTVFYRLKH